jgi:hypothetical protein
VILTELDFPGGVTEPFGDVFTSVDVRLDYKGAFDASPVVQCQRGSHQVVPLITKNTAEGCNIRLVSERPIEEPARIRVAVYPFTTA